MTTVHSNRLGIDLHLGKQPARPPSSDHVAMRDLLNAVPAGTLPPIPSHFGHGYDFGQAGWKMLANGPCDDGTIPNSWYAYNGVGDCAWAGPGHETMEAARDAGRPVPEFTCLNIADQYASYLGLSGGAEAITESNDQGSDVQDVLTWRQTKGLVDKNGTAYKIGQTVSLTPGDMTELWAAAYLFETVGIGVNLQEAQMDQFDAGQPWNYVAGSPIDGGHYIPVMGNNGLISWGQRVGFTQSFIENCCDEAYTYLDPERYRQVTGETAEGYTNADLEQYIVLVAQAKAA